MASQVSGTLVRLATLFFGLATLQLQRPLLILPLLILPLRISLPLKFGLTFLIEAAAVFLLAPFHLSSALFVLLSSQI